MEERAREDEPALPPWERELRAVARGRSHRVGSFSAANFPALASALGVPADAGRDALMLRLRYVIGALERQLANDWRYSEFRARLAAACAWWAISDLAPVAEQWAAHVRIAKLRTLRQGHPDTSQRSFRHSAAGFAYRQQSEASQGSQLLESSDYENGRREPFKTNIQDALVAVLQALIAGGDGVEFWDTSANELRRVPVSSSPHSASGTETMRPIVPGAVEIDGVPEDSPWRRAKLEHAKNFHEVQQLAAHLWQNSLPALLDSGTRLVDEAHLLPFSSLKELGERLHLLTRTRDVLDRFSPTVFERPLAALVQAYEPRGFGTALPMTQRRQLRRQAAEYLRPGVHVSDMGVALADVSRVRGEWQQTSRPGQRPEVPAGVDEVMSAWRKVEDALGGIERVLGCFADRELVSLPLDALRSSLEAIAADAHYVDGLLELLRLRARMTDLALQGMLAQRLAAALKDQPALDPTLAELNILREWEAVVAANPSEAVALRGALRSGADRASEVRPVAPTIMAVVWPAAEKGQPD